MDWSQCPLPHYRRHLGFVGRILQSVGLWTEDRDLLAAVKTVSQESQIPVLLFSGCCGGATQNLWYRISDAKGVKKSMSSHDVFWFVHIEGAIHHRSSLTDSNESSDSVGATGAPPFSIDEKGGKKSTSKQGLPRNAITITKARGSKD